MFRNLTVNQRLTLGFGILIAIIMALGLVTYVGSQAEERDFIAFAEASEVVFELEEIETEFLLAREAELEFNTRYAIEGLEASRDTYVPQNQAAIARALDFVAEARVLLRDDPDALAELDQIEAEIRDYSELFLAEVNNIFRRGDETSGLEGTLLRDLDLLVDAVDELELFEIEILNLQATAEALEYLLAPVVNSEHIAHFEDAIAILRQSILAEPTVSGEQGAELLALVDEASASFATIVQINAEIAQARELFAEETEHIITFLDDLIEKEILIENAALEDFEAIQQRIEVVDIVVLVAGLILGITFALNVRQYIIGRLSDLTGVAQLVQQGNYAVRADESYRDDFGQLGTAFNAMSSEIASAIDLLEQRVAERTRDIATAVEVGALVVLLGVFDPVICLMTSHPFKRDRKSSRYARAN